MSHPYRTLDEAVKDLQKVKITFYNCSNIKLEYLDYWIDDVEAYIKEKNWIMPATSMEELKRKYKILLKAREQISNHIEISKKINEILLYDRERVITIEDRSLRLDTEDELKRQGYDVTKVGDKLYF